MHPSRTFVRIAGLLCLAGAFACSSSSDETPKSQLPSEFGDCGKSVCVVALGAFTKHPGVTPYCEATRTDALANLSCTTGNVVSGGTCADVYVLRIVYGFPGDHYDCVYDAKAGKLVGARWAPDSHPTQIAGKQMPDGCNLDESPCGDAGVNDAGSD